MNDCYKILGVEEEASDRELRARWFELTKDYHPYLKKTKDAAERIKEINEAYGILGIESARFEYDLERDLDRLLIKKAHTRKERGINIRKIVLPSGIVAFFLIVCLIVF